MYTTVSPSIAPSLPRLPWPLRPLARLRLVAVWYDRWIMRQHLADLDDHMLNDIGLDRKTVRQETEKPFWVA